VVSLPETVEGRRQNDFRVRAGFCTRMGTDLRFLRALGGTGSLPLLARGPRVSLWLLDSVTRVSLRRLNSWR
jgi:hypothetical protein